MVIDSLRRAARGVRDALGGPAPAGGVVLLYHRVAALDDDPERLSVSPEHFAAHLDVISRQATCVPLRAMVDTARRGTAPIGEVAITFDDGYADLLHAAAPAMASRGLSATMFVTTGVLDPPREFWWDALERAVFGDDGARGWHVECPSDPSPRHREYRAWRDRLRGMSPTERDQAIDHLVDAAGVGRDVRASHRPLTAGEVGSLAGVEGITIGAHGVSHASLAALSEADRRAEIDGAGRRLAALTGADVSSLAYPFGGPADTTDEVVRAAADAGFELACTATPGRVHAGTDPLRVPRMIVRDWAPEVFEQHLLEWIRQ